MEQRGAPQSGAVAAGEGLAKLEPGSAAWAAKRCAKNAASHREKVQKWRFLRP